MNIDRKPFSFLAIFHNLKNTEKQPQKKESYPYSGSLSVAFGRFDSGVQGNFFVFVEDSAFHAADQEIRVYDRIPLRQADPPDADGGPPEGEAPIDGEREPLPD